MPHVPMNRDDESNIRIAMAMLPSARLHFSFLSTYRDAMPRFQDILFILFGVLVAVLLAFDLRIAMFALVGAFACGAVYLFAGMLPSRTEGFWPRVFTSVFLAAVLSCLVLILPGTLGANRPDIQGPVLAIAALLPVAALCFEIARTPRVVQTILRSLGRR